MCITGTPHHINVCVDSTYIFVITPKTPIGEKFNSPIINPIENPKWLSWRFAVDWPLRWALSA